MIKTVIFDMGGVLHESTNVVTDDLQEELGLSQTQLREIWSKLMPSLNTGEISEEYFWDQVRKKYGIRKVSVDEDLLGRAFAKHLKPYDIVESLVLELRADNLKVAVLSNTIESHAKILKAANKYEPFDVVFLSYEVGLRKPNVEIFKHALTELGIVPGEALFIDDDPRNVHAATGIGMSGIVAKNPEQVVRDVRAYIKS